MQKARKWKIKKNDFVGVISGAYKGARGRILKIDPKEEKVYVEGVNVRSCKVRSAQGQGVERVEREIGFHASNVMLVDPSLKNDESQRWSKKSLTRVGLRVDENGRKIRYAKRSGSEIGEVR